MKTVFTTEFYWQTMVVPTGPFGPFFWEMSGMSLSRQLPVFVTSDKIGIRILGNVICFCELAIFPVLQAFF